MRRHRVERELPEDLALTYLESGVDLFGWQIPADRGRALWEKYREGIMKHYFAEPQDPGRRPWALWVFEHPQDTIDEFPPRNFTLTDLVSLGIELTSEEQELIGEEGE